MIPSYDDFVLFLHVPLKLQGVTCYFTVRAVTLSEYKSDAVPKFYLIAEPPEWAPSLSSYTLHEDSILNLGDELSAL